MEINPEQLETDLRIDEYNLQEEWARQTNMFMDYASKAAKIKRVRDLLKRKLVRKFLKGEKMSDAALGRKIDGHPDVIELQYQRDLSKYAVQAFEMRKKSLEHLQQLFFGGFFAEPKEKPIKKPKKKKK